MREINWTRCDLAIPGISKKKYLNYSVQDYIIFFYTLILQCMLMCTFYRYNWTIKYSQYVCRVFMLKEMVITWRFQIKEDTIERERPYHYRSGVASAQGQNRLVDAVPLGKLQHKATRNAASLNSQAAKWRVCVRSKPTWYVVPPPERTNAGALRLRSRRGDSEGPFLVHMASRQQIVASSASNAAERVVEIGDAIWTSSLFLKPATSVSTRQIYVEISDSKRSERIFKISSY